MSASGTSFIDMEVAILSSSYCCQSLVAETAQKVVLIARRSDRGHNRSSLVQRLVLFPATGSAEKAFLSKQRIPFLLLPHAVSSLAPHLAGSATTLITL